MKKIKFLALQAASKAYGNEIHEHDYWSQMSEEEKETWCWENASQPLEGMDGKIIKNLICQQADTIEETFLEILVLLKEKINEEAVGHTFFKRLTSSANNLDFNALLDFHDVITPRLKL
jgi:hypothetical protein